MRYGLTDLLSSEDEGLNDHAGDVILLSDKWTVKILYIYLCAILQNAYKLCRGVPQTEQQEQQ